MENQATVKMPPALPEEAKPKSCNLPGFVLGFVISDLVFCCFRVFSSFIGLLGLIGLISSNVKGAIFYVLIFEIFFNLMIVIFGGLANVMILCKKAFGVKFAYISIFVTVCSVLVSFSQFAVMISNRGGKDTAMFTGEIIGFLLAVLIRCTFLGFYCKAISKAKAFFSACSKTNPV